MNTISHKVTKAEIDYGILNMRESDGTTSFFETLPRRFTIILRGKTLQNRQLSAKKVWIGYTKIRQFKINEKIKLTKKGSVVYIK